MHITLYEEKLKNKWDEFVSRSKNGTFLLLRDYMDYHKHRFTDASLFIHDEKDNLLALLPAHRHEDTLASHQGLTYGGLIYDQRMTQPMMLKMFQALLAFLPQLNIKRIIYKTIPHIYHRGPAGEDLYALFLLNAKLKRRDTLIVIDNAHKLPFQTRRNRAIAKAQKSNLHVERIMEFTHFWKILEHNLLEKYGASPVHSITEITLLAQRFPENIKLFICRDHKELLAGVVIYETELVAHCQYIAASQQGKQIGALDWLFSALIQDIYSTKRYIDFGISNEQEGRCINQGLIDFKEGFGGRSIAHDHYHIELTENLANALVQAIL